MHAIVNHCRISIITIILLMNCIVNAESVDFSKYQNDSATTKTSTKPLSKSDRKEQLSEDTAVNETIDDLKTKLFSADHLLKKQVSTNKKYELQILKIVTQVQIARKIRIQNHGKLLLKEESNFLNQARSGALELLNSTDFPADKRKYLYYLLGLIYMDLNEKTKSIQSFELSINGSKGQSFLVPVSLYLGDLYFEERKYNQALEKYQVFESQMGPVDKKYVEYKLAWISLNMGSYDKSIDQFIQIIQRGSEEAYYKDSISSVAFLLADTKEQEQCLDYVRKTKLSTKESLEIISLVYFNISKNAQKSHDKLLNYLLQQENDSSKKARIIMNELNLAFDKKNWSQAESLYEELLKLVYDKNRKLMVEFDKDESSILQFGEILIDNRLKKIDLKHTTTNSLNSQDLKELEILKKWVARQYDLEKDNTKKGDLVLILLNLYLETKDYEKVHLLSVKALKDQNSKTIIYSANTISKIQNYHFDAVSILYEGDQKKWKDIYVDLLVSKLKDRSKVEKGSSPKNIDSVRNSLKSKLLSIYVQDEKWQDGINLLQETKLTDMTSEELEKISFLFFKLEDCDKIQDLKKLTQTKQGKIEDYLKECRLVIAKKYKSDPKKFDLYEKNIIAFIADSAEDEKKYIAVVDYLTELKNRKNDEKLERILLAKKIDAYHPKVIKFTYEASMKHMLNAQWEKSLQFSKNAAFKWQQNVKEPILYELLKMNLLATLAIKKKHFSKEELKGFINLDVNSKLFEPLIKYMDRLFLLLQPHSYLEWAEKNHYMSFEKDDLFLASKLARFDWSQKNNHELFDRLSELIPADAKPINIYKSFQFLQGLKWDQKWDDSKVVQQAELIRASRSLIKSDIPMMGIENKIQILKTAKNSENKMSDVVLQSVIPSNLSSQQVIDYKNGLQELANEFQAMAKDYEALIIAQQKKNISTTEVTNESKIKKASPVAKIDWPKGYALETVVSGLIKSQRWWELYILTDLLQQQKQVNLNQYCQIRQSLLRSVNSHREMLDYIQKEKEVLKCQ